MADLSQTAASVLMSSGPFGNGVAGATITAGMPLYSDAGDTGSLKPAQATSSAAATFVGIATHGAADGQPIRYAKKDAIINFGATLAKNTYYVVSANAAGAIAPSTDLGSGEYITVLAVGDGTAVAKVIGISTGVAVD